MKDWNFGHWLMLIIGILILTYILSPAARKFVCNSINKFKGEGAKCSDCDTKIAGIITAGGQCVPAVQVSYDSCIQNNSSLTDGADCTGCGSNPDDSQRGGYSGKGVIVGGTCRALPDAFAGKMCVPENAKVNALPISYKRILIQGLEYKYYKNDGSVVSQSQMMPLDTEIDKAEYVQAFVQTTATCPTGQVKV